MFDARDVVQTLTTSLGQSLPALMGGALVNLVSYLQLRSRVQKLEAKMTTLFRLLLRLDTLDPGQRALVEELLQSE